MAEENTEMEHEEVENQNQETESEKLEIDKEEWEKVTGALKKANKEAAERRHQLKEIERQQSDFKESLKELGIDDPSEVPQVLENYTRETETKKDKETELEQLRKKFAKEREQLEKQAEQQVSEAENTVRRYLVDNEAMRAISKHDGVPKLLMPQVTARTKIVKEDGEYLTRVVDEEGKTAFNGEGNYMTVDDLVAELKEDSDFSRAFNAPKQSGGGSGPQGNNNAEGKDKPKPKGLRKSDMGLNEKIAFRKEYGMEAYNELPQ